MKPMINELTISEVYQNKDLEGQISIYFTFEDQLYRFLVLKDSDGLFKPFRLSYVYPVKNENFLFTPDVDKHDLFGELIKHPRIRLEWLYLPH